MNISQLIALIAHLSKTLADAPEKEAEQRFNEVLAEWSAWSSAAA